MFNLKYFKIWSWEYSDENLCSTEASLRTVLKDAVWTLVAPKTLMAPFSIPSMYQETKQEYIFVYQITCSGIGLLFHCFGGCALFKCSDHNR